MNRDTVPPMTLDQGDPRLLETDIAKRLLTSKIPARCAYTALDGTPRVVGSWLSWTGEELVLPTSIAAPHVRHATYRVRALGENPDVAISIDTESFPPEVLSVRGGPRSPRSTGSRLSTPRPHIAISGSEEAEP